MEPVDDPYDRQTEQLRADIKSKLQPEDYLDVSIEPLTTLPCTP